MDGIIVNIIAIAVILLIVGGAVFYLIRAKKRGEKCVGCPYAKQCGGNCGQSKSNKVDSTEEKNEASSKITEEQSADEEK